MSKFGIVVFCLGFLHVTSAGNCPYQQAINITSEDQLYNNGSNYIMSSSPYGNSQKCRWYIDATGSETLRLDFFMFEIEQCGECGCDSLILYDAGMVYTALQYNPCDLKTYNYGTKFCGYYNSNMSSVMVNGSRAVLDFCTDHSVTGPGFGLYYSASFPTTNFSTTTWNTSVTVPSANGNTTISQCATESVTCECPTEAPVVCQTATPCDTNEIDITCTRGVLSFSEKDFVNTAALTATLTVDGTFRCFNIKHQIHTWLLEQNSANRDNHYAISRDRGNDEVTSAYCESGAITMSDTDPDMSTTQLLSLTTTGNWQCRKLFFDFLTQLFNKKD